jgi:predicted ester cyclase
MSIEENKTRQRRVFEEVFNKGNLAIIPEFIAPDYVYRSPLGMEAKGPEGFKQMVARVRTAFPDIHFTIEDIIAEGDKVVTRFTRRSTHQGEFMGIAPTGKKVTITGILITRWVGGKEVEAWESLDTLAMFQQLGVVPPMGPGKG